RAQGRPPVRGAGQAGGGRPARRRVVHALRPPAGHVRGIVMNWVASALLLAAGLDDKVAPPPAPSPQQVEQLAKEKSPKAFVQALEWALVLGDAEAVKAAHDLTTEDGPAFAEA